MAEVSLHVFQLLLIVCGEAAAQYLERKRCRNTQSFADQFSCSSVSAFQRVIGVPDIHAGDADLQFAELQALISLDLGMSSRPQHDVDL
jgi:hypothetical protein